MKLLTWLLTATAAGLVTPGVLAKPAKPCTTTTKPTSKPTKIPTPTLANGNFERSADSFAPWVEEEGPWGVTVTTVGAHKGKSLLVTAPQFAEARAGFTIAQKLTGSTLVAGVEYTLTGFAFADAAHDATHGCSGLYIGCNGAQKVATYVPGTAPNVGRWKLLKSTCKWTSAQIAKGPKVFVQGKDCLTGHYLFDDLAIKHA